MNNNTGSIKPILIAAAAGAAISWALLSFTTDDSIQREQIAKLENRILDLEFLLEQKEKSLDKTRTWSWDSVAQGGASESSPSSKTKSTSETALAMPEREVAAAAPDIQQTLKNLSTTSDRDPRSFSEKVTDLLATNPSQENIAIASQGIVDMAESRENMPDQALEFLYQSQTNPELKRVAAQVLSMRGNNGLMEKQISEARSGLRSSNPLERQKVLVELAKTRYAGAANIIAPLLQDNDNSVKLDALLALRATGNQSHVYLVESLVNHPDPAISWLAHDVVDNLQNLSDKARTRMASADIVAELPVMAMQ
jgi:hypothetical protein